MLGLAASDDRRDSALADEPAVLVVVVAAVADHLVGPLAWPADEPGDSGDAVEQRDQLRDVVAVAARERVRERDAGRVDEEWCVDPALPLSTGLGPVSEPPFSALQALPWVAKGR